MRAIAIPVLNNFKGFVELVHSLDGEPYRIYVYPNWKENHGVAPAWNHMINRAKSDGVDFLLVSNDDVLYHNKKVIPALETLVKNGVDLASPTNETGVCHSYGLNFWSFAINPQTFFSKFGEFDENFAPAYYEDDDMAYRIKLARGRIFSMNHVKAYHHVGQSEVDPLETDGYYAKNLEYYIKKWGGPPQHEKYRHPFNNDKMTLKDW
jgi:GT2 family glycosyltransferase